MQGITYILATIVFTIYGQIVIKWRIGNNTVLPEGLLDKFKLLGLLFLDPFVISGLFAAFLSAVAWMAAMTKFEVSFAYPIVLGGLVLGTNIVAIVVLHESVSWTKISALLLVILGISLLVLDGRANV